MRTLFLSLALVIAVPATALAPTAAPPAWEFQWALPGITEARGLTMDAQDRVYAVDGLGHLILKYDADGNSLGTFGTEGSGNGQLSSPTAIASDGTALFVADQGNRRIQKLTASGSFLAAWGDSGSGDGEFLFLIDVEVAPGGDVYTLDGPSFPDRNLADYRVQRFTSQGTFVQKWGSDGSGPGQFNFPGGIAIDAGGNVYVADAANNRIQKFSPSGAFLDQFGATQPTGIDADRSGNVYAIDRLNVRVQQFKTDGTPVSVWGSQGPNPGEFETPWDVTTSSTGDVFVSDNQPRIQRFGYTTAVEPSTWGAIKTRYPR